MPRTMKGERTRAAIQEAGLGLVRERGFEQTTMRAIARAAKVSLGSTYYYYRSKDDLIQALYARTHAEHLEACRMVLAGEQDFEARLLGAMCAKLDTLMPYHRFAGALFKSAADPASPLNPFSDASLPVRREATALFAEVVRGSSARVPSSLQEQLPNLLWLYHMGIVLFWVHDRSPGCRRSYDLVERSVELVATMIRMAGLPLLGSLTAKLLELLDALEAPHPGQGTARHAGGAP